MRTRRNWIIDGRASGHSLRNGRLRNPRSSLSCSSRLRRWFWRPMQFRQTSIHYRLGVCTSRSRSALSGCSSSVRSFRPTHGWVRTQETTACTPCSRIIMFGRLRMTRNLTTILAVALVAVSCIRGIQIHPLPAPNPTTYSFAVPLEEVRTRALQAFSRLRLGSMADVRGAGSLSLEVRLHVLPSHAREECHHSNRGARHRHPVLDAYARGFC